MTANELYNEVVGQLPIKELHPLHKSMMEECCEKALSNPQNMPDKNSLVHAVRVAFLTCNSTLKGILTGSMEAADTEKITLNYRNQTFIITKNSSLLN